MKKLTVDELWNALVESNLFTKEELQLATYVYGYNVETLNALIYSRYGYRDYEQMIKRIKRNKEFIKWKNKSLN